MRLKNAVAAIEKTAKTSVAALSHVYKTAAWGYTDQRDFYNICVLAKTSLPPLEFLKKMQKIERDNQRVRLFRWGPRTLDIDIVLFEGESISTEELTLPHPRYRERAFVLRPMADIYPDLCALGNDFSHALCDTADQRVEDMGELSKLTDPEADNE